MTPKRVRKAVFPVGGLGTRFLPATKAIPKEMLPVVDRPLIQYAVEEALEAGIEQMIFVTGRGKAAIEDHFDIAYELEATMAGRGKSLEILGPTRLRPGAVSLRTGAASRDKLFQVDGPGSLIDARLRELRDGLAE